MSADDVDQLLRSVREPKDMFLRLDRIIPRVDGPDALEYVDARRVLLGVLMGLFFTDATLTRQAALD